MNKTLKPDYYKTKTGYELYPLLEELPFWKANAIKYIFRAGNKKGNSVVQDLQKAMTILSARIEKLQSKGEWQYDVECTADDWDVSKEQRMALINLADDIFGWFVNYSNPFYAEKAKQGMVYTFWTIDSRDIEETSNPVEAGKDYRDILDALDDYFYNWYGMPHEERAIDKFANAEILIEDWKSCSYTKGEKYIDKDESVIE